MPTMTRAGWALLALAAVVVVAAVGVVGYLVGRDGSSRDDATDPGAVAAQVAALREGCDRWAHTEPPPARDQWCAGMATWMLDYMGTSGVGPQMMWGDSARLRSTCREWVGHDPADGPPLRDASGWCDRMVEWMNDHMGAWSGRSDWGDWMMHGSMMR